MFAVVGPIVRFVAQATIRVAQVAFRALRSVFRFKPPRIRRTRSGPGVGKNADGGEMDTPLNGLKVGIWMDTSHADRYFDRLDKQVPYALSRALNATLKKCQEDLEAESASSFDRPTKFTQKAWKLTFSNKRNLTATIEAKPIQAEYLQWQVSGGSRPPKRRAIPIAAGQKRNQYGNIPRNAIPKMLQDKKRFFSGVPKGGGRPAGIWRRLGTTKKAGGFKLQPMILWKRTPAHYSKRLQFEVTIEDAFNRYFEKEFEKEFRAAMRTAKW